MSVGIDKQYYFKFNIDNNEDFIHSSDLDYFNFVEESGGGLPTWEIAFYTEDSSILKIFNEGNDFEVSYGIDLNSNFKDMKLHITKFIQLKHGEEKFYLQAFGTLSNIKYIVNAKTLITDKKSGVEVMHDIGGEYFRKVDSNTSSSTDKQYWVRDNISAKKFLTELWMHSYLSNSFLGYGVNINNDLVIRDFSKLGSTPKFTFSNAENKENITYVPDYVIDNESGFINCFSGYGLARPVYTVEDDTHSVTEEDYKKILAMVSKINRKSDVETRSVALGIHNENTHDKYWQAASRNVQGLSIMSSVKNTFTFGRVLNDIQVLDLIEFFDDELNSTSETSIDTYSGLWVVGHVGRSVSASSFTTTIEVYRESYNKITGDLR